MLHSFSSLKDCHLAASDGSIGHVRDVYFDSREWTVRFLVANTGSWLLGKEVLIPVRTLGSVNVAEASISVNLTLKQMRNAPEIDTARPVSRQDEIAYHEHYGIKPVSFGVTFDIAPAMPDAYEPLGSTQLTENAGRGNFHLRSAHDVTGHIVRCSDAEIGRVGDLIVNENDWSVPYLIVNTGIWFGKKVVVPTTAISEVCWDTRTVYLTMHSEMVKSAPEYDANFPLVESYMDASPSIMAEK